jgi:hypothetical protein
MVDAEAVAAIALKPPLPVSTSDPGATGSGASWPMFPAMSPRAAPSSPCARWRPAAALSTTGAGRTRALGFVADGPRGRCDAWRVRVRVDVGARPHNPACRTGTCDHPADRRDGHGQGHPRATGARVLAARRQDVRAVQLHGRTARDARQPAVRPPPWSVHGRTGTVTRRDSRHPGRHAVPRRDRRAWP